MDLLPKYIKYKIVSELGSLDLFNFHLTSKDNYQLYRSEDFWAYKLKVTTQDWQNGVGRGLCQKLPLYEGLKNIHSFQGSPVSSYSDVHGNLYVEKEHTSNEDIYIFDQLIGENWARVNINHLVENFIYMRTDHMLLLMKNHDLQITFRSFLDSTAIIITGVKKIGIISHGMISPSWNIRSQTYFVTDQDELRIVQGQQCKHIATNVTHVISACHHDIHDNFSNVLYYVVRSNEYSVELWCYQSANMTSELQQEFDCITSISHCYDTLYIDKIGYSNRGLGWFKNGQVLE